MEEHNEEISEHVIIAYIAQLLSNNNDIEDFSIYNGLPNISLLKFIFIKVWFKSELAPHIYFMHVTNFDLEYDYLTKYEETIYMIMNQEIKHEFLNDVSDENVHFWIYSKKFVNENILLQPLENNLECKLHFLFETATCYKIKCKSDEFKELFNEVYLCSNKHKDESLVNNLQIIYKNFTEQMIIDVLNYIKEYFKVNNKLTKNIFDTELLTVYLHDIIVQPSFANKMNLEVTQIWNRIIFSRDITIIEHRPGIENNIFGCLNQQIKDVCNIDFQWNKLIENTGALATISFINKLLNSLHYPSAKVDTIENLLLEMWKLNYVPLTLKPNNSNFVSILKNYKYLKKKFIVIGNVQTIHNEVKSFCPSALTNVNDIYEEGLKNEFLNNIIVSLQGRKPATLFDIIDNNENCTSVLTCSEILHLIKKQRKIYINELDLIEIKEIVFIISDNNTPPGFHMNTLTRNNNVIAKCNPNSISEYFEWIKTGIFQKDPIVYLKMENSNILEVLSGDLKKIKQYLVDSKGNSIYVTEDNQIVPVLGKNLSSNLKGYVERSFRKAFLDEEVFFREKRSVFFIGGDIDSYKPFIRAEMVDLCDLYIDCNLSMWSNKSSFLEIRHGQSIKDSWAKFINRDCQLFHINVVKGNLELLKANKCETLTKHVLYSEEIFPEKDFFKEIPDGITLICGEPGIGKSWMLHSLSENYDGRNIILFCNLTDFYDDFLYDEEMLKKPLDFIFNKYENSSSFLHPIYDHHRATGRLILFLDCLDEILPICKDQIFKFLKKLAEDKVRIVATSRFHTDTLLINSFNFRPVRIVDFTANDAAKYLQPRNGANINIQDVPVELHKNPMYLKLLNILDNNKSILDIKLIDKLTLYERIIQIKITDYQNLNLEEFSKLHQIMALVVIFGKEMILNEKVIRDFSELLNKFESLDGKSHFINKFCGSFPIFEHHIFAEFFAVNWLMENLYESSPSVTFYKYIMDKKYVNIRYLFDSVVCKNLILHKAVLEENLDLVRILLQDDQINLTETDQCGRTALLVASTYCKKEINFKILEEIVRFMIKKGCYLYNCDKYMKWNWIKSLNMFYTGDFFRKACKYGLCASLELYLNHYKIEIHRDHIRIALDWKNLDVVLMLLKRNPVLLSYNYKSIIQDGIDYGRLDIVYDLVSFHCKNSFLYNKKFILFDNVCRNEFKKITTKCIKKFLKLKIKFKFTALHLACFYGNAELVNELVKLGANLYAEDEYGHSPLHYAIIKGSLDIVNMLIQHMPHINVSNRRNSTPLHLACKFTNLEIINAVIKKGIDINHQDYAKYTVLMNTCIDGKADVVQILVDSGADIKQRNINGDTALHLACDYGKLEIAKLLLKNSVDLLYIQNNEGHTPIEVACSYRKYDIVTYLSAIQHDGIKYILREKLRYFSGFRELKKLIEKNILKEEHLDYSLIHGQTPLHIATKSKFSDTVAFLIEKGVKLNPRDDNGYTPLHFITSECFFQSFKAKYNQEEKNSHIEKVNPEISNSNIVKMTISATRKEFYSSVSDINTIKLLLKHCSGNTPDNKYPLCTIHLKVSGINSSLLKTILSSKSGINLKLINAKKFENTTMTYLKDEFIRIISIESGNRKVDVMCVEGTIDKIAYLLTNNLTDLKFKLSISNLFTLIKQRELEPLKILFKENFINRYDLECSDDSGQKPLHYAAQRGLTDIIRFLLEAGVKINSHDNLNETPLYKIISEKDLKLFIEEYKQANLDLNEKSYYGYTALHRACQKGMNKIVEELLAANVSASCQDNYGNTPLCYAKRGKNEIIIKLLENVTTD